MRYNADDSTTFWAIGADNKIIAKHSEVCAKEVEMVVPFEGDYTGEVQCHNFIETLLLSFRYWKIYKIVLSL